MSFPYGGSSRLTSYIASFLHTGSFVLQVITSVQLNTGIGSFVLQVINNVSSAKHVGCFVLHTFSVISTQAGLFYTSLSVSFLHIANEEGRRGRGGGGGERRKKLRRR